VVLNKSSTSSESYNINLLYALEDKYLVGCDYLEEKDLIAFVLGCLIKQTWRKPKKKRKRTQQEEEDVDEGGDQRLVIVDDGRKSKKKKKIITAAAAEEEEDEDQRVVIVDDKRKSKKKKKTTTTTAAAAEEDDEDQRLVVVDDRRKSKKKKKTTTAAAEEEEDEDQRLVVIDDGNDDDEGDGQDWAGVSLHLAEILRVSLSSIQNQEFIATTRHNVSLSLPYEEKTFEIMTKTTTTTATKENLSKTIFSNFLSATHPLLKLRYALFTLNIICTHSIYKFQRQKNELYDVNISRGGRGGGGDNYYVGVGVNKSSVTINIIRTLCLCNLEGMLLKLLKLSNDDKLHIEWGGGGRRGEGGGRGGLTSLEDDRICK
jgi:hypothetical protein